MATVDKRIVEMLLRNEQFESNASKSMKTVDSLNKSLNSLASDKSIEIGKSIKSESLSGLATAVDAISSRFSNLGVIATSVLSNIASDLYNTGKQYVSMFTTEPVLSGFKEYETQINAVQTILSNTRKEGATLDQVNAALDELNHYADMTIYNFTEMTRNIGTFTAAGVDLETSVAAIKGISNLAAISGSDSNQASRAMYQLSQAIAAGTVNLQDWNSVVNAGMGGQVFQDALKETAHLMGLVTEAEPGQSFRESIGSKGGTGWLTSEVLLETLKKFTGDLTEAELIEKGYTEEQAKAIVAMGEDANNAATKVKTFTQLIDTLKEAAQSGWTQSWETIIGDFGEAKEIYTTLSDKFSEIIGKSAEARNSMLQFWAIRGGRDDLIRALLNVIDAVVNVASVFKSAMNDIFPPMTGKKLAEITKGFADFTEKLKLSEDASSKWKSTFKGVFSVIDIFRKTIVTALRIISPITDKIFGNSGKLLELSSSFGDFITNINKTTFSTKNLNDVVEKGQKKVESFLNSIKSLWEKISPYIEESKSKLNSLKEYIVETFGNGIDLFDKFSFKLFNLDFSKIKEELLNLDFSKIKDRVLNSLESLSGGFKIFKENLKEVFSYISNIKSKFSSNLDKLGYGIKKEQKHLKDDVETLTLNDYISIGDFGILAVLGYTLKKFIDTITSITDKTSQISKNINTFLGNVGNGVVSILKNVSGVLEAYQGNIKSESLINIAKAIAILSASILLLSLTPYENLAHVVSTLGAFATAVLGLIVVFKTISSSANKLKDSSSIFDKILEPFKGILEGIQTQIKANALISISKAILLLIAAIAALSFIPTEKLIKSLLGLTIVVVELSAVIALLSKIGNSTSVKSFTGMATTLLSLSSSILIISGALAILSNLEPEKLALSLTTITLILVALEGFLMLTSKLEFKMSSGLAIVELAYGLKIMTSAVADLGSLDVMVLISGLNGIAALLLEIGIFSKLLPNPGTMIANSTALILLSTALLALSASVRILGGMDILNLGKGLLGLGGILVEVALGMQLMKTAIPGALALLVVSGAIAIFTPALAALSLIPITGLATALGGLAIAFGILGAAGYLLSPITPQILALSASLGIISAGVSLVVAALALLASSFSLFVSGLAQFSKLTGENITQILENFSLLVAGVYQIMPRIYALIITTMASIVAGLVKGILDSATDIASAIVYVLAAILETLADCTPSIVSSVINIILAVLEAISNNIGNVVKIVVQIISELINALGESVYPLVDAGVKLIIDFINGVADAIIENSRPLADAMINLINSLIIALIEGFRVALYTISPSLAKFASGIIDNIEKTLGSNSSSSKFEKTGVTSGREYASGLKNSSKDISQSVKSITEETTTALNAENPKFKMAGESNGGAFVDNLKQRVTKGAPAVKNTVGDLASSFNTLSPKYGNAGSNLGSSFTSNLSNQMEMDKPGVVETGNSIFEELTGTSLDTINNSLPYFQQGGESVIESMENGTLSGEPSYRNSVNNIMGGLVDTVSDYENDFANAGENCMEGLVEGFRSGEVFATNAVSNVMASVLASAQRTLKVHSPSQEFFWMGEMSDKGMALGLSSFANLVTNAATNVGDDAIRATRDTISRISDISFEDLDANPVISPVIDLTNVAWGSQQIDALMNAPRSFSLTTSKNFGISDTLGAISGQLKDSQITISAESTATDEKIITAINSLESRMAQVGEAVTNMQVIMDTGALVGQIASPMDRSLGKMANMRKRGI